MASNKEIKMEKELLETLSQLRDAQVKIEELTKKYKETEMTRDSYWKYRTDAVNEIETVHAALDTLPRAPVRKVKVSEYSEINLSIPSRLFGWMANFAFGKSVGNKE